MSTYSGIPVAIISQAPRQNAEAEAAHLATPIRSLSLHQSPQDGAGGGRTSSSDAVAQASTLLHHRKLKLGMWRHMRCLHDLGMAHTFHTAVPHTSTSACMATSQCPIECITPKKAQRCNVGFPQLWDRAGL